MKSHADICAALKQLEREHKTEAAISAATQEAYRFARIDRRTQHFQPLGFSGDSAALESHDLMHRRIRHESINNAQIRGAERNYVDLIIGSGMVCYADPFVPWEESLDFDNIEQSRWDDDIRYMLESDHVFDEWANDPKQCDAEGKLTWWEMQRMLVAEAARVGFCMLLSVSDNSPGRIVSRCFQILEREQLDTTKDRIGSDVENKIVNGIEKDARNRAVAYWVLDANPYDTTGPVNTKSTRIPASRIKAVCRWDRPSETAGVSWFAAIGQNSLDRDGFLGAELQTAKKVAALALVVNRKRPGSGSFGLLDGTDEADGFGNPQVKLGGSPIAVDLGTDEKVEIIESNRPNSNAGPFVELLDHDAAVGLGQSYYSLTGRYENTSFSSANAAKLDEEAHMRPMRKWFADHVAIPVRREINAEAILRGKLTTTPAEEYLANPRKFDRFEAVDVARGAIDPGEIDASIARLRSGQSTLKRELASAGLHWIKVFLQRAMEDGLTKRLGLTFDFSKGNGGGMNDKPADPATDPKKKKAVA
jgi:lambda family phage portal protein